MGSEMCIRDSTYSGAGDNSQIRARRENTGVEWVRARNDAYRITQDVREFFRRSIVGSWSQPDSESCLRQ